MNVKIDEALHWVSTFYIDDLLGHLDISLIHVPEMNKNKMDSCLKIANGNSAIFIKTNLEENYKRFVIFHEIGHYLLHYENGMKYSFYLSRYKNRLECEANNFACLCLLQDENQEDVSVIELLERKGVPSKIAVQYYDYYK